MMYKMRVAEPSPQIAALRKFATIVRTTFEEFNVLLPLDAVGPGLRITTSHDPAAYASPRAATRGRCMDGSTFCVNRHPFPGQWPL